MGEDAVESALRSLRHRDRSTAELDHRLEEKGFSEEERAHALDTLRRTGLVDDARFALARAESLAARGAGDARVRSALREAGLGGEVVEEAIAALDPEPERARRIVERRGGGQKTARYLHGHGFAPEVVAEAVAAGASGELP